MLDWILWVVFILAVAVTAVGVWGMFRSEQIRDEIRDNPGLRASDFSDNLLLVRILFAFLDCGWRKVL